jgi:hypothetical protein
MQLTTTAVVFLKVTAVTEFVTHGQIKKDDWREATGAIKLVVLPWDSPARRSTLCVSFGTQGKREATDARKFAQGS